MTRRRSMRRFLIGVAMTVVAIGIVYLFAAYSGPTYVGRWLREVFGAL